TSYFGFAGAGMALWLRVRVSFSGTTTVSQQDVRKLCSTAQTRMSRAFGKSQLLLQAPAVACHLFVRHLFARPQRHVHSKTIGAR
ncbi:hypothetical protein BDZ97DRAFT_1843246, partial [Flammula alnicola]